MLTLIDEFTLQCLAIKIERRLNAHSAIDALRDLFILPGVPACIRSDTLPRTYRRYAGR